MSVSLIVVGTLWWTSGSSKCAFLLLASCQLTLWDEKIVSFVLWVSVCIWDVILRFDWNDFKGTCWETWVSHTEDIVTITLYSLTGESPTLETVLVSVLHIYCPFQFNCKPCFVAIFVVINSIVGQLIISSGTSSRQWCFIKTRLINRYKINDQSDILRWEICWVFFSVCPSCKDIVW